MSASLRFVITGASAGLGLGLARWFLARGHRVGMVARDAARLEHAAAALAALPGASAGRIATAAFDVGEVAAVRDGVTRLREQLGGIDVLVNNAAAVVTRELPALELEEIAGIVRTNVTGTCLMIRSCLPALSADKRGHVVNIASINGNLDPLRSGSAYTASKFALRGLGYSLTHELAPLGVRVTTLLPGPIDSRSPRHDHTRDHSWKLPVDALAGAIEYAVEAPAGVDVSEIELRPTARPPALAS